MRSVTSGDKEMGGNFKQEFFQIYDRKLMSGETTFRQTGLGKEEFTRLCTEDDFILSRERIEELALTMKLTEEEKKLLLSCTV